MPNNSTNASADEVRLDNYFAAVWRAKWLLLLVIAAAVAATFYYTRSQPVRYTANATLEIGSVWKEPLADTYVVEQNVNTAGFKHDLAQKIGVRPNQLKNSVQATTITAGPNRTRYAILLKITAITPDESQSIRFAQAVADELIARHEKVFTEALASPKAKQLRLEKHLERLYAQGGSSLELTIKVEDQLDEVKFNNTSPTVTKPTSLVEPIVAEAVPPASAWNNAAAAGVLAAIAAVVIVVVIAYFKPVIRPHPSNRHD
jgi:hypothetical protein